MYFFAALAGKLFQFLPKQHCGGFGVVPCFGALFFFLKVWVKEEDLPHFCRLDLERGKNHQGWILLLLHLSPLISCLGWMQRVQRDQLHHNHGAGSFIFRG